MKLIIDIDKNIYHRFTNGFANENDAHLIEQLFKNGKPYEERPQGEWIGDTDYESYQGYYEAYKCNRCGYGLHWRDYTNEYKFCPNCGADMRSYEK